MQKERKRMTRLENDPRLVRAMEEILQGELQKEALYIEQVKREPISVPETLYARLMELLQEYNRKYRARRKRNHILLIAAVLAALLLGACVAIEPLREAVFGAIITKYEDYFDFEWKETSAGNDLSDLPEIPCTFGYVPEGYELVEEKCVSGAVYKRYERTRNDSIVYEVYLVGLVTMYDIDYTVTSEIVEETTILIFDEKENEYKQFIWADDHYFYNLSGFVKKEELIKMIESLT